MNMLYQYKDFIEEYFYSKDLLSITVATAAFLSFVSQVIDFLFLPEYVEFIYWRMIIPFCITVSMVYFMYYFVTNSCLSKWYERVTYQSFLAFSTLILGKSFINFLEIIFFEIDLVQTAERSNIFYFLFFLLLSGGTFLAIAFFLPAIFFEEKITLQNAFDYCKNNIMSLLAATFFSFVLVFCVLTIGSFLLFKLSFIFSFFLGKAFTHLFIEDFLNIYLVVLFWHLYVLYTLKLYLFTSKKLSSM
jgi:hypothetical protein